MPVPPWPILLLVRELTYGGTERQLTEIAKALDRSRFCVHVGCFLPEGPFGPELRAAGVSIARFPLRSLISRQAAAAALRLARYIRLHSIPLVHTFDVPATMLGVFAARAAGASVVLSSQRAHRELTPGPFRHVLRLADRTVDGIVVNCEAMRRHLVEDEGVPARLIHLCYNSIDTGSFSGGPRWRPDGLESASLVIGVVCVLRPEKGLPVLMEAFARLRPSAHGLKLLIIGSGPVLPELETLAGKLGIRGDCVFQPAVSDVARWLRALDIFVLPSLSEALSNSLMEAMAAGRCVVATRVGGNPELVLEGKTGLLVPAGDPQALADTLRKLIAAPALREALGSAAAAFIAENFSRRAVISRMERIYTGLLETAG